MWFGKLSLKVAALALVGAVSSMAAKSTTISSLTFGDASTDAANWAYLLNYKLWGQTEISFGNNNKFPKPAGWVGSATGDLLSTGNDAQIAGTVIVGGKIDNTGKMAFTTGPVRYGNGITDGSRASGTKCSGTTTSGACAEVPLYKDIKVPTVKKWPSNLQSIRTPDHGTYEIDVTSGSTELYFDNITFGQESTLLIKMPAGGVFTSIITKHLNIPDEATHPKILVQYEGENLPEDKKSIAITVTFQPKDKSYTDAELEALMNKVINEVSKKTGAVLR
jgi:hypothetical protein